MFILKNSMNTLLLYLRNLIVISLLLLPAIYFLLLLLSSVATNTTESTLGVYEITFRPLMVSILMLFVLWILSLNKLKVLNKYFWCLVSAESPSRVIYFYMFIIFSIFGAASLAAGLVTVIYGVNHPYGMFNQRDNIFFSMAAAVIFSPFIISWHLIKRIKPEHPHDR
jgi:hypothetical protein